jgi:hypothetical protein
MRRSSGCFAWALWALWILAAGVVVLVLSEGMWPRQPSRDLTPTANASIACLNVTLPVDAEPS